MNISLSEHFDEFIRQQVESGPYANASEVIRAGLDRLAFEHVMRERMMALIDEGIASEEAGDYTDVDDLDSFFKEIWKDVIEERRKNLLPAVDRAAS